MLRILIPAYNEEKNIKRCIEQIAQNVHGRDYEFYIVDDGSKDGTRNILEKLSKTFPLRIIIHKTNLGVSAALQSGIKEAVKDSKRDDNLVIMEGDGTSDPSLLPLMIEKIKGGCDLVIASRYKKGGGYKRFPPERHAYSLLANFVFRRLFPFDGVSDYTIFYRVYRVDLFEKALGAYKDGFISHRYFVANTEILIKLLPYAEKVCEIPFLYDYGLKRGRSGINVRKNAIEYLKLIKNVKLKRLINEKET